MILPGAAGLCSGCGFGTGIGFKEFKTSAKLAAQFDKLGIPYRKGMAITAVKGVLKGGKPGPTIAILGELDAIGCPEHPQADPDTGAAHACGHHMQQSSMLAAAYGLAKTGVMKDLCGNVVFFGVPAEEYVQIAYRKKLRKEGEAPFPPWERGTDLRRGIR